MIKENPYKYVLELKEKPPTDAMQAIRKAYISLLQTKDYADITVKELCKKAHVARSTFYAYYENVSEVLAEIENELIARFFTMNLGLMEKGKSDIDDITFFETTVACVKENRNTLYILLVHKPEYRFIRKFKDAIKYHFWERKFDNFKGKNAGLILEMVASVTISAYAYWITNPYEINMDSILKIVSEILKLVDECE